MRGTKIGDWWVERRNHLTTTKVNIQRIKPLKIKIKTAASKWLAEPWVLKLFLSHINVGRGGGGTDGN